MKVSREHIHTAATAAYRDTAEELGADRSPRTCTELCRRTIAAIDEKFSAVRQSGATVACAPGCAFCCHLRVGVFVHEAMALLHYLDTCAAPARAAEIRERILRNARQIDGLTVQAHYAARIPCAFLADGRCSAYEVRPSACAAYHSMSRARCEHAFEHPADIGTPANSRPALLEVQTFCGALIEATGGGLNEAGLSSAQAELHQVLRALIENPALAARWRAGHAPPDLTDAPSGGLAASAGRNA